MMAGNFAFGLMARKAGVCCSPLRVSIGTSSRGGPFLPGKAPLSWGWVLDCSKTLSCETPQLSYLLAQYEGVGRHALGGRDPHAFGFEIFTDRFNPALASDARALHSSERHHVADGAIGVDPHRTRLQCRRHPDRSAALCST